MLSDEDVAFFREHGWLIVRHAVPAERVAALTQAFDEVIPAHYYSAPTVWQIPNACRNNPAFWPHLFDAAVAERVADVLGCKRVQLLQDTLLLKPPVHGGRVEWHQDYTYTGYLEPASAVSVRLALTDCNVGNGCLNVLDGSHLWGLVGETRALSAQRVDDALGLLPAELAERAKDAARPIELSPGDLSIHHCLTFHSSFENRSPQARKTVIMHAFNGDCRLAPERLPNAEMRAYFPTDENGRLMTEACPVLYERG